MNFDPADSLGALPLEQIAEYLVAIGDDARADALISNAVQGQNIFRPDAPFMATGLQMGYIASNAVGSMLPVSSVSEIAADRGLIGRKVKVSFDRAYICEYPGIGAHSVLCEFVGRNQIDQETEELRMALRFKCADRTLSSIAGAPIFLGLTVGPNGIAFEGRTVNVSSDADEILLAALDGEAFKQGLTLVNNVQPGLKPLVSLVQSAVKSVAKRARNKQVQHFNLGLDFDDAPTSARLRFGSYLIAQTNEELKWSNFHWNTGSNSIVSNDGLPINFNYLVIRVSQYFPDLPRIEY